MTGSIPRSPAALGGPPPSVGAVPGAGRFLPLPAHFVFVWSCGPP